MREDLKVISGLIEPEARVFDIGCGKGDLLTYLAQEKQVDARGIDSESERVGQCVSKGLMVVHGDADTDLATYPDNAFDYVVLAKTLQVMHNPKRVLEESLRVGRKVLVSIPNFGHINNRLYLAFKGRMPVTSHLSYQWYETPNIHFSTIRDFINLCDEVGSVIESRICIYRGRAMPFTGGGVFTANLFGNTGVFCLRKDVLGGVSEIHSSRLPKMAVPTRICVAPMQDAVE